MNWLAFAARYQQRWHDPVTIGPAAIPFPVVATIIAALIVYLALRFVVGKGRVSVVWNTLSNAFIWGILVWKLAPLLQFFPAISRDPLLILRIPGGQLGITLGTITALIVVARSISLFDPTSRLQRLFDIFGAILSVLIATIVLTVITTVATGQPLQSHPQTVPETMEIQLLDGQTTTFGALRGRPVVLSFWATWCAPCRAEFPHKIRFFEQYGEEVTFLAVNLTATEPNIDAVRSYVVRNALPFPIAIDSQTRITNAFMVRGTPTTVLINDKGEVLQRWFGPISFDQLKRAVDAMQQ